MISGCSPYPERYDSSLWTINTGNLPQPDISLNIEGLGPCTDNPDRTLHLNSQAPTTILAHGCFSSSGRFRALSEVFAFQGQQTACFSYNDRDSLMKSSAELIHAVEKFSQNMENKNITVIGHSQGGLISRKAFVRERNDYFKNKDVNLRLITVSAPFSGIDAASHCGSTFARVISLGLIVPVCYAVSGDKWYEITAASAFIQNPGRLVPQVSQYLKIVTDERNTCRQFNKEGICIEDDYVFSVDEQYYPAVDNGRVLKNIELQAGHVEIVGDRRVAPRKLIRILQEQGVLRSLALSQKAQFDNLLTRLYELE